MRNSAHVDTSTTEQSLLAGLAALLATLSQSAELAYYLIALFPEGDRSGLLENLVVSNWPRYLLFEFDRADVFRRTTVVQKLKRSIKPSFSEAVFEIKGRRRTDEGNLQRALSLVGIGRTLGFSLSGTKGNRYIAMFSGTRAAVDKPDVAKILLGTFEALDDYILNGISDTEKPNLSEREIDCLRWVAAGKSSVEIAAILSISRHTVNEYTTGATRKLGCVNRTQAVAAACRLGLI